MRRLHWSVFRFPLTEVCVRVLGINAIFHDPAAAVAVDGKDVALAWRDRMPAVVPADGTARFQTVEKSQPLLARLLHRFAELTGLPVVVNTSPGTAGRPMAGSPRDAFECFGSAPVDVLAIGSFPVRREGRRA
jgi:predicted NodU family carbamoyl transferase